VAILFQGQEQERSDAPKIWERLTHCIWVSSTLQIRDLTHISNMNFLSWAVLGSWSCRGKKNPNCHKYAALRPVVLDFMDKKNL
jgi:hypothetical protein